MLGLMGVMVVLQRQWSDSENSKSTDTHSMHILVLLLNNACSKALPTLNDRRRGISLHGFNTNDGLVEGEALPGDFSQTSADGTQFFYVTYSPFLFIQMFELIFKDRFKPCLVRNLRSEIVLVCLIIPEGNGGFVTRKDSVRF